MENCEEAKKFGEKSLEEAKNAEDDVWQLNASVLVAQAEGLDYVTINRFESPKGRLYEYRLTFS